MNLSARIALLALAGAIATGSAYRLQGQRIDENGILHEPFALVPITYLLIAVSGLSAVLSVACRKQ
ncbi:DUF3955 domain-containing protein [Synechococcus sp. BA-124 BA4]|uniref:DUF3955 domain-containing protein n=1 Tax=unclassified Synechococcus TaxID=2626047 RepID=UPI0018CE6788|nr:MULTISPECIES: DUF3955 domain-containing protein [unclassified Synechococcus]MEA5401015.1 DUF3955 domain-containing protein [Synechococcus sp. BA-124 BA4]QPN55400.1 DUF3955 domain-containing protein [Synechococcus sp. CBW1107]CAK6689450.1 hypothetical protein BBFGKLBO_00620 [Synechococcus sp. CBW1107]